MTDEYTIKMNPKKNAVLKNTADGDISFLEKSLWAEIRRVMNHRAQIMEMVIAAWLIKGHPGAHPGELVLESHMGKPLDSPREVLRVIAGPYWGPGQGGAGPVLAELPPIQFQIVEE